MWEYKPDKINRNRMTQTFERGGLKRGDTGNFIYALKLHGLKYYEINEGAEWTQVIDSDFPLT